MNENKKVLNHGETQCHGRMVEVYEYYRDKNDRTRINKRKLGEFVFHKWGCDYDEFESGPGNFSTAIVEDKDGTVKNIPVGLIKFVSP